MKVKLKYLKSSWTKNIRRTFEWKSGKTVFREIVRKMKKGILQQLIWFDEIG